MSEIVFNEGYTLGYSEAKEECEIEIKRLKEYLYSITKSEHLVTAWVLARTALGEK